MNLFVKACHGRFHDILAKEYSGTFPELLLGKMIDYKMRCLQTIRVSQSHIVTRKTNTSNKSYYAKQTSYYTVLANSAPLVY